VPLERRTLYVMICYHLIDYSKRKMQNHSDFHFTCTEQFIAKVMFI
jgi:hypothetical protein